MNDALKELATPLLVLLAVVALLTSALGPMLDHHFAERHPAHGHLYLGVADSDHLHSFEHSHVHYDAMYAPAPGDGNVVFFAPYDVIGHAYADIVAPAVVDRPSFRDPGDPLIRESVDTVALLRGATLAPPLQPPRA